MRKKIYNNILELCGDTPLVRLNKIVSKDGANVFVKLEMFNPAGSIKDRIAFSMIEDAEKNGRLKSGGIIVESSSGNTGVGLAMAGAVKGYTVIVICDRYLPMAKKIKLLSFGAHIIFLYKTPKGSDTVELRLDLAKQIASMLPNGITLNQYDNLVNRETHYRTTGPEIVRDLDGKVNAVVCAVGTTGTLSGAGKAIKELVPTAKVIGVEPEGSIIFGGKPGKYLVQGGGLSFIPKNLDRSVIDIGVKVSDTNTFRTCRGLALREGLMVGGSAGGVVYAALKIAKKMKKNENVVCVLPDGGDRYLETIYSDTWLRENKLGKAILKKVDNKNLASVKNIAKRLGCTVDRF